MIDSHCHLASEAYDADRGEVLERAWNAGLSHVVAIGESRPAAETCLALAAADQRVSVVAGVHPHDARDWDGHVEAWLVTILKDARVVAAGEMGLDYHYDHSPRDRQRETFEAQLQLAAGLRLPAVIHAREADDDIAAILRNHPGVPAILHSFSSGPSLLRAGLDLGHYVSFSGMVTFRTWALDDAVRAVPLDRLLVETDGPYLAPVPLRGKRNEPAFVRYTAKRIAQVRGLAPEDLVAATDQNAARLLGPRLGIQ
jgi:TatD DNase family protein